MLIFGFDPGGENGVAVGWPEDTCLKIETGLVSSVSEAIGWLEERAGDVSPYIIGIDAFLWWSADKKGWRQCDHWLKKAYPAVRNSVLCTNSTYGSMAVQGMALACLARKCWPEVLLNEVHPKVLLYALNKEIPYPREAWPSQESKNVCDWMRGLGCKFINDGGPRSEHEFDAALAVWASFQGIQRNWDLDLATLRGEGEIYPAGTVNYFWPHDQMSIASQVS